MRMRSISTLALALSLALAGAAPTLAVADDDPAPIRSWRFIDGDGVAGVMRLADDPGPNARGFFVIEIEGRGVFEGVYNLKEDARSAVGMFWPEGLLNTGSVSGFLDIGPDGVGGASFMDGDAERPLSAR